MRFFIPFWLLAASLLTTALAGCCGTETCDCFDEGEDLVTLSFDTDSLSGGFRRSDIRSAYVVRYALPDFTAPLDTFRQPAQANQYGSLYTYQASAVQFNGLFQPRPEAPSTRFPDYNYRVVLPTAGKHYEVTELRLNGETTGGRCCSCYRNTQKSLRLDGVYLTAEGYDRRLPAVLRR